MSKSLPGQLNFKDPLELTLREAYEKYHRQPSHKPSYVKAAHTALAHWERCTLNPTVGECDDGTMQDFSRTFLRTPLPSKVATLLRRARRKNPQSLEVLRTVGVTWMQLQALSDEDVYRLLSHSPLVPEMLLPTNVTSNAQLRTLEAIFSTLGPKHRGNPYARGFLTSVPCCRPESVEDPEVVFASEEDLSAIYSSCDVATWPHREKTGVHPPDLWRAFVVYLYNLASRRGDFLKLEKTRVKLKDGVILTKQGKSGKTRAVPINVTVVNHIRAIWFSKGDLLFPFPRNKRSLYETWYQIQRAAGISVTRLGSRVREPYYGFHEIRKTSLGEYYALNEHAAQEMGAHSALATTLKHYVPAVKREGKLRKAVESLPQPQAFSGLDPEPTPTPPPGTFPRLRIVG
ncbi:tyrosine-type recombinase/integrase [Planctomicrobium sp. SH661]|uniref:tyrosine-type recombinase/integrase n=1 Tax=Planctomicrobium sp. SH661 TaxID=3448124 RepID=UPI003F5B383D